ncbi:hypothetical protein TH24_13825 [Thalassospira xiamenensis]|nr:hypothetical protein TH24_13825 [Thalassospira xiamenensis]
MAGEDLPGNCLKQSDAKTKNLAGMTAMRSGERFGKRGIKNQTRPDCSEAGLAHGSGFSKPKPIVQSRSRNPESEKD